MCYGQKDDLQIQTQNRGNYLPCVFTLCTEAFAQVALYRKRIQNNAKQAKQPQIIMIHTTRNTLLNSRMKSASYIPINTFSCIHVDLQEPVPEGRMII